MTSSEDIVLMKGLYYAYHSTVTLADTSEIFSSPEIIGMSSIALIPYIFGSRYVPFFENGLKETLDVGVHSIGYHK